MSDKTLTERIKNIRSESEEYFYLGSAFIDDREKAEAFALVMLKTVKLKQIAELEAQIRLCESGMKYNVKIDYEDWEDAPGYEMGIRKANEGRKKTHEQAIAELKKDIEAIGLNIIR